MNFSIKNNEHTKDIIESLNTFGEEVRVDKYSHTVFIEVDTSDDSILHAIVCVWANVLRISHKEDSGNAFEISLKDIETIYDL